MFAQKLRREARETQEALEEVEVFLAAVEFVVEPEILLAALYPVNAELRLMAITALLERWSPTLSEALEIDPNG